MTLESARRGVLDRMWMNGEYGQDDAEDVAAVDALIDAARAEQLLSGADGEGGVMELVIDTECPQCGALLFRRATDSSREPERWLQWHAEWHAFDSQHETVSTWHNASS